MQYMQHTSACLCVLSLVGCRVIPPSIEAAIAQLSVTSECRFMPDRMRMMGNTFDVYAIILYATVNLLYFYPINR
jgi:hypothetical protein